MAKAPASLAKEGRRAGLPLARAQRLAAETERRAGKGRAGVYGAVGVLSVAGLVVFGLMSDASNDRSAAVTPSVASVAPPLVAEPRQSASTAAVIPSESTPTPQVPVASSTARDTVSGAAEPMRLTSVPVNASNPACVQAVETRLSALYQVSDKGNEWAGLEEAIGNLVQAALDCDDAQLRITGSMELAGTDLADIRVAWEREDWLLDLEMVDFADRTAALPAAKINEERIEFVIR